jgi:hypothetical protein
MIKSIVVFLCIICILLGSTYNKEHFLYRLGDMVRLDHKEWGRSNSKIGYVMYKKKYPYSIAKKYMDRTKKINNYSVLLQILNEYTPKVTCDNCLIIHLRIGDVLDNSDYSVSDHLKRPIPHKNKLMYVKPLSYYIKTIKIAKKKKIRNIILIGGYHTNTTHTKSDLYVDTIEKLFRNNNFICKKRINQDPDDDFVIMCNAKYFLPSGGGFSSVITEIVRLKGGTVFNIT